MDSPNQSVEPSYEAIWSSTLLAGQIAVVTGVSGGIGAEIVQGFAATGARVYGLSRSPESTGQLDEKVTMLACDAGNEEEVRGTVRDIVAAEGRIDIAVANAARYTTSEFWDLTAESWHDDIRVNLTGAFFLFQAVAETMRKQNFGSLVAIGSTAGERGGTSGHTSYGATKAGLEGLCKGIARELGPHGVRANVLALGSIDGTKLSDKVKALLGDTYGKSGPLGRPALATEAANGVIFLASAASSFVTGSVVRMDGGALYSGR